MLCLWIYILADTEFVLVVDKNRLNLDQRVFGKGSIFGNLEIILKIFHSIKGQLFNILTIFAIFMNGICPATCIWSLFDRHNCAASAWTHFGYLLLSFFIFLEHVGGWNNVDSDPAWLEPDMRTTELIEKVISEQPLNTQPGKVRCYSIGAYWWINNYIDESCIRCGFTRILATNCLAISLNVSVEWAMKIL